MAVSNAKNAAKKYVDAIISSRKENETKLEKEGDIEKYLKKNYVEPLKSSTEKLTPEEVKIFHQELTKAAKERGLEPDFDVKGPTKAAQKEIAKETALEITKNIKGTLKLEEGNNKNHVPNNKPNDISKGR